MPPCKLEGGLTSYPGNKKGLASSSRAEAGLFAWRVKLAAQLAGVSAQSDAIDSELSRIEEELTAPSRHSWDRAEPEQDSNKELARKRDALLGKKRNSLSQKVNFLQKQEKLETPADTFSESLWNSIAEKSNRVK